MNRGLGRAAALAAMLFAAHAVAQAGVDVDSHPDADLTKLATYAWKTDAVVAPDNTEVQGWIVAAVERELDARGLRRVEPAPGSAPDVWVVTYAGTAIEVGYTAPYLNGTWSMDVNYYRAQDVIEGSLVVSLVDPETDDLLWRGVAKRSINPRKADKLRSKIDKATRDMFKQYPAAR